MICSSMRFAEDILKTKKELESKGHIVHIPVDTEHIIENPHLPDSLEEDCKHLQESNILKRCFDLIAESDAILVLNYEKHGVKGYMGTSVLMEVGLAHYLEKKIFLLNNIPDYNKQRWAHEVHAVNPIVLNGNLERIE